MLAVDAAFLLPAAVFTVASMRPVGFCARLHYQLIFGGRKAGLLRASRRGASGKLRTGSIRHLWIGKAFDFEGAAFCGNFVLRAGPARMILLISDPCA